MYDRSSCIYVCCLILYGSTVIAVFLAPRICLVVDYYRDMQLTSVCVVVSKKYLSFAFFLLLIYIYTLSAIRKPVFNSSQSVASEAISLFVLFPFQLSKFSLFPYSRKLLIQYTYESCGLVNRHHIAKGRELCNGIPRPTRIRNLRFNHPYAFFIVN